jgi:predicted component of type VI protein secretion system
MNTPTPRTEAMRIMVTDNDTCKIKVLETVHAPFARTLEREVIALTAERDQLRADAASQRLHGGLIFRLTARAEKAEKQFKILNETLQHVTAMYDNAMTRAERAEAERTDAIYQRACEVEHELRAELATERARLDAGTILLACDGVRVWHCDVNLRAAIDAGVKEGAK